MILFSFARTALIIIFIAAQVVPSVTAFAQTQPVTVIIVQHPKTVFQPPTFPLSQVGQQRAELLVHTFRDLRFTHIFATHTTRARQTVEPVATAQKLEIVQLPVPGSIINDQTVSDMTSSRVAIKPIADAVLKLPAGSVVLIGANSDNIYGILNRLGVPVAESGTECAVGTMCVPCLTNECFPVSEYDHLWYLVIKAGSATPIVMFETRYGAGWSVSK